MKKRIDYKKEPLSLEKQVALLKERGLIINDEENAKTILSGLNYYRFSGYTFTLEEKLEDNKRTHIIKEGITFEQIVRLHDHDRKIQTALFAVLSDIEIYLKSKIAYYLTTNYNNAFIHYDTSIIKPSFMEQCDTNKSSYEKWLDKIEAEVKRTKETFIKHYKETYNDFPKIPFWMCVEVMSMGSLSMFFSMLTNTIQKEIFESIFATTINYKVFASWLHSISYMRNLCAHHSRVFNRVLAIKPKIPKQIIKTQENERLGHFCILLSYIIQETNIDATNMETLQSKLNELLKDEAWLEPYICPSIKEDYINGKLYFRR